ncbi:proto-oncogene Mas-like [Microcaecilia unicolor]|uniref:Proto-oncogene Mas-like n=1 Tax=Microcaecilia unicolor TaxID=1415580 RepID=A0A6P7XAM2_9AMPH|nr:proto-oncogene Mas-like [Microcaecilia unicolor]
MIGLNTSALPVVINPGVWTMEASYYTDDLTLTEPWDWTTEISNLSANLLPEDIFMYFTIPVFCFFGLVGNGILLWFLGFKIKRNKFTVYILNLAISDFLILLGRMVGLILFALEFMIGSLYVPLNIFRILSILYIFGYNTNQYLLTAISAERCMSTLYPIWYHCWRPKHLSFILCAILWALASVVSGLEYSICIDKSWSSENLESYTMAFTSCQAVSLFIFILAFLVFMPIMVICSLTLLIQIWKRSQRRHSPKLYIIIVVTVFLFLICSTPFRILFFTKDYYNVDPSELIILCFTLLSTVSSCSNPLIYFFIGNHSRRRTTGSLKAVLEGVFKDEDQEITAAPNICIQFDLGPK